MLGNALFIAAFEGKVDKVSEILTTGKNNVNGKDNDGHTALMLASKNGHVKVVKKFLEYRADIHTRNNAGMTALTCASTAGSLSIVQLLLKFSAKIEDKDSCGDTPLIAASLEGHLNIVQLLLEYGARINERNNKGYTALTCASLRNNIEVIQLLLDRGAEIQGRDNEGKTALTWASINDHPETVKLLLDRGAHIQSKDDQKLTALHECRSKEVAEVLLKRGAAVDCRTTKQATPLMIKSNVGRVGVIELLLQKGADVNLYDNTGDTAAHYAVDHLEVMKLLLVKKIDLSIKNNKFLTALDVAEKKDHKEIVQLIEKSGLAPKRNEAAANSKVSGAKTSSSSQKLEDPDIFISYQWAKQTQIKALYKKLTQQGYSCWLDINQMGGGEVLFDEIENGIKKCKVMLSCVTERYSVSENCKKEVSLADALKKPIIPLLLEKIDWPPAGMGMVFASLIYINFCKPDVKVQDHWECPQMAELIGQIKEKMPNATRKITEDMDTEVKAEPGKAETPQSQVRENIVQVVRQPNRMTQTIIQPKRINAEVYTEESEACTIL